MTMKNIITIVFAALLFTSCEKVVDIGYNENQSGIIIEGNVTNQIGPYFVKITRSIRLADTLGNPTIDNAIVSISDDAGNNDQLIPQGNGLYRTTVLKGVEGRTYTLIVKTENKIYTAKSTMPKLVPFDSIRVDDNTFAGEMEYNLIPKYKDPTAKGNNYRFVLRLNNKLVNQHFILDDVVINGIVNTLRLEINDDDYKVKPGDLVSISMECIDEKVALYYKTLALMADSGPGGGTTPSNPPNNLSDGALGLFSAHTEQNRSKIVP